MEEINYILGIEEYTQSSVYRSNMLELSVKIAEDLGIELHTDFYPNDLVFYYISVTPEELKKFLNILSEKM